MDIKIAFPDCTKCQKLYEKWTREDYPQHYLYARNPKIKRGPDDPMWCVCGRPWPHEIISDG